MSDIALRQVKSSTGGPAFDLAFENGDLVVERGLQTAIINSIFNNRLAAADDLLPSDNGDRQGWWADAWPAFPGDQFGSRLWLLERNKNTRDTHLKAKGYVEESLAWLVETGRVSRVEVRCGWIDRTNRTLVEEEFPTGVLPGAMGIIITTHRAEEPPEAYQFEVNFGEAQ